MQKLPLFKIYALLGALIIIWGLGWPMNKIGLQYMPPLWFAALRLLIGAGSMFCLVISLRKFIFPTKEDLPLILSLGFLQTGLYLLLINLGLAKVDAGRSAILAYTTPIWVMPLAVFLFKETATFYKKLGFLFGITGILVLFSPWSIDWADGEALLGNGYLLLAAFCMTGSILCSRYMRWTRSPMELLPWQLLVGAIPVLSFAAFKEPSPAVEWNMTLIGSLLYTATLGTAFGYWCANVISKALPATTFSLGLLGVPLCGLMGSVLILNEPMTMALKMAMFFIPTGLIFVTLGYKKT